MTMLTAEAVVDTPAAVVETPAAVVGTPAAAAAAAAAVVAPVVEPTAEEVAAKAAEAEAKVVADKAAADKIVNDAAAAGAEAHAAEQLKTITDLHTQWKSEVAADKEYGGDKLAENLASANAAMKATCTPQLIALLDKSGLGNNPEVIRHFFKIAPAFAEGKHVPGGKAPTGDAKSAERVLYPNNA